MYVEDADRVHEQLNQQDLGHEDGGEARLEGDRGGWERSRTGEILKLQWVNVIMWLLKENK